MIKVGQLRKGTRLGTYVITKYHGEYNNHIIRQGGGVFDCADKEDIEKDKLIAEYPTWQEAVNSKEFNG